MSNRGDPDPDSADDTVEAALMDHHLDEVAAMIEQAQADEQSSDTTAASVPAGYRAGT